MVGANSNCPHHVFPGWVLAYLFKNSGKNGISRGVRWLERDRGSMSKKSVITMVKYVPVALMYYIVYSFQKKL